MNRQIGYATIPLHPKGGIVRGIANQTKSLKTDLIQDLLVNGNEIIIQVFPKFEPFISTSLLHNVVSITLRFLELQLPTGYYLGIIIGDNKTIKDLNLRYRGLDEITDVLSFSTIHQGQYYGVNPPKGESSMEFPNPAGTLEPVGEVLISYPKAKQQALKANIPVNQELITLLVHGTLHIFGFDHESKNDEETMVNKQSDILKELYQLEPGIKQTQ